MAGRGLACLGAAWRGEAGNVSRHVAASRREARRTEGLLGLQNRLPVTRSACPADYRTSFADGSAGAHRPLANTAPVLRPQRAQRLGIRWTMLTGAAFFTVCTE